MHEPFALRYTRTLCDAFEDLDPSPDRFDRKVNGRSIQAAALGYISNLSRITYLLSKRNLKSLIGS
jgi:hypothetical protein